MGLSAFSNCSISVLSECNQPLVRRLVEKVTVYKDKFIAEFKSGVTVDVKE
jgi:site-specific DNA recombinase